jgi:outer membrane protein assembly factor BamB
MSCRRRLYRLAAALAVGVAIVVATGASPAQARVTQSIALKPASGPPTTKVSVSGNGFGATEGVVVDFGATKVATATTSSTGSFSASFKVPKAEAPGSYPVKAIGQVSGRVATKNFLVRTNAPMFHFNAARSGLNPYENVISPSNVSGLAKAWTDTVSSTVGTSPAVVNGVAYVAAQGGFYALNAATGAVLWSDPGIFFGQSSPAVVGGVAYAAGVDGNFYAFKASGCGAATCKPLWTAAIDGAGSVAQSSPTVVGGVAYVSAGYNFYAFSASGCGAATCKPLWIAALSPTNGESPVSGQSSPAVVGGVVYVGGYEGLYAYSTTVSSAHCSGNPVQCSPLWFGHAVRAGLAYTVYSSSPAVVGGVAYVGAGGVLFAFSTSCTSTCDPLWSFPTGNQIGSSPAVANGRVYIGSQDGKMYVLSTSGALQWTAATRTADSSSPTVANGVVYIGANQNIDAFNATGCSAATCSPLWTAPVTGASFASPVVVNGMVYQGETSNGQFLAAFKLP